MKYTTRTEYGLVCLVYIARNGGLEPTTARQLAGAENYSQAYIEKILQNLRNAGIVQAQHGNHGGYTLAKASTEITLRDVIEAMEGKTFDVFCEPETREHIVCNHLGFCGLQKVWQKARNLLDNYFESVTLQALIDSGIPVKKEAVPS